LVVHHKAIEALAKDKEALEAAVKHLDGASRVHKAQITQLRGSEAK
jgi:hypothetical protein